MDSLCVVLLTPGAMHNTPDLVQLVEFYMSEHAVDWKEAYWQLKEVMERKKEEEVGSRKKISMQLPDQGGENPPY